MLALALLLCTLAIAASASPTTPGYVSIPCPPTDTRCIPNGWTLSNRSNTYAEQPYCQILDDASWTCVMTYNGEGWVEGTPGEHMVAMQTRDQGRTWSSFADIEPPSFGYDAAMTSSYGSVVARPDGSRIFAVYVYNAKNATHLPHQKPNLHFRADMLGPYFWRFSDDGGRTWSTKRYEIPVPTTAIDRTNSWNGSVLISWEVDHVKIVNGTVAMFAFTKIHIYDLTPPNELFIAVSRNLLTEADPEKVAWEFWPEGDHGVQPPNGPPNLGEEPHILPSPSSENPLYYQMVMRTTQGYMGNAVSDHSKGPGAPWLTTSFATYAKVGSLYGNSSMFLKQPRGPQSPKRQPDGTVLMTYYNNAGVGAFASAQKIMDRCVMWLTLGIENPERPEGKDGRLLWSQPEVVLYDTDRTHDHGYPDVLTTKDGRIFITETYKGAAHVHKEPGAAGRVHEVDARLLSLLRNQGTVKAVAENYTVIYAGSPEPQPTPLPESGAVFGNFTLNGASTPYRHGFSIDMQLLPFQKEAVLLDATVLVQSQQGPGFRGVKVVQRSNASIALEMADENGLFVRWSTDPVCSEALKNSPGDIGMNYVAVVVDAGVNMISFMVNGKLCDGGPDKDWSMGWLLFDQDFGSARGAAEMQACGSPCPVNWARVWGRALFVSELVGNYRANSEAVIAQAQMYV